MMLIHWYVITVLVCVVKLQYNYSLLCDGIGGLSLKVVDHTSSAISNQYAMCCGQEGLFLIENTSITSRINIVAQIATTIVFCIKEKSSIAKILSRFRLYF